MYNFDNFLQYNSTTTVLSLSELDYLCSYCCGYYWLLWQLRLLRPSLTSKNTTTASIAYNNIRPTAIRSRWFLVIFANLARNLGFIFDEHLFFRQNLLHCGPKNCHPFSFHYSFYNCCPFSMIFDTHYTELICNTTVIDMATSPTYCCCTTLENKSVAKIVNFTKQVTVYSWLLGALKYSHRDAVAV